jgi:secreted trypsin-like serine protease
MQKYALVAVAICSVLACGPTNQTEDAEVDLSIIGGEADSGDPSVVAIFVHAPSSSSGSLCTGTVISSRAILTAAHCVAPSAVGSDNAFDVYTGASFGSSTSLSVARVAYDPAFSLDDLGAGHDIAVLTLSRPTTLPAIPWNRSALGSANLGAPVRLVGYGASSHDDNGAGIKRSVTTAIGAIEPALIQIGSSEQQTCHGDSGGPALQRLNGVETVVGVTSFGYDKSSGSVCFGGGYDTRVDTHRSFISRHL